MRNKEILQSWESLKYLITKVDAENIGTVAALEKCLGMVEKASSIYERKIGRYDLDQKSNADHLPAIQEGIKIFGKLAELDLS
jgi:hypothetical protein